MQEGARSKAEEEAEVSTVSLDYTTTTDKQVLVVVVGWATRLPMRMNLNDYAGNFGEDFAGE